MTATVLTTISIHINPISFIEGGGLSTALIEIGGNELEAAIEGTKELNYSKNPTLTLNRILTHLESAEKHFFNLATKSYGVNLARDLTLGFSKSFWICCLMAICHKYLGNLDLVKKYLIWANYAAIRVNGYDTIPNYQFHEYFPSAGYARKSKPNVPLFLASIPLNMFTSLPYMATSRSLGVSYKLPMKYSDFKIFCYNLL